VEESNGNNEYHLPVFANNQVAANVVVTTDLVNYIEENFNRYYIEKSQWQWLIDTDGKVAASNIGGEMFKAEGIEDIKVNIAQGFEGFIKHEILIDQQEHNVLSAYYPIHVLNKKYGIIFTLNTEIILNQIYQKAVLINSLSFGILVLGIMFILQLLKIRDAKNREYHKIIDRYSAIMENLPFGLMVLDKERIIKSINQEARSILSVRADENLVGKNITERFLEFKNYTQDESSNAAFDANQFVYFEKGGNELTVYKRETSVGDAEEELFIEAIFDVTSLEKARKYEAASNNAKSEFLAKMSHEIRTPMNGIIGMVDALEKSKLKEEQKDQLRVIKKSADLLMNIINDVLDISKIEAGKMQIEEIPFSLREEIKLSIELFKPIVEEKGLEIHSAIKSEVPDNLIGDPYRLRQVITNLVSNAVKFTHEGRVVISCQLEEKYSANVILQFCVEDTGIGISKEKLPNIFNSFTQEDESTTRMYGGTGLGTAISKQLVDLMNGEIWADSPSTISTVDKYPGSKFCFTVEVFSNERLEKSIDFESITAFSDINTLIVVNKSFNIKRLRRFLERLEIKYSILEGDSMNETEMENLYLGNQYQLVFMVHDQDFNAFNLAEKIKAKGITDKSLFIMLSHQHKSGNYIKSKSMGIDYYLIQPFEHKDIIDIIYDNFTSIIQSKELFTNKIKRES
jgi:PAS domain S-box-containing protein